MDDLPDWPDGTVAILSTGAGAPHAIPVSLVLRAGPRALLLGLAERRGSLARLREDPRCAMTVLAAGDHAFTATGRAVAFEPAGAVVGVRIEVDELVDHNRPTYEIEGGVQWRWTDAEAEARDGEARAALRKLPECPRTRSAAGRPAGPRGRRRRRPPSRHSAPAGRAARHRRDRRAPRRRSSGRTVVFAYPAHRPPGRAVAGRRRRLERHPGRARLHAAGLLVPRRARALRRARRARPRALDAGHGLPAARPPSGCTCPIRCSPTSGSSWRDALRLPTFEVDGLTLLKRLTLFLRDGAIESVIYPGLPADRSADQALARLAALVSRRRW